MAVIGCTACEAYEVATKAESHNMYVGPDHDWPYLDVRGVRVATLAVVSLRSPSPGTLHSRVVHFEHLLRLSGFGRYLLADSLRMPSSTSSGPGSWRVCPVYPSGSPYWWIPGSWASYGSLSPQVWRVHFRCLAVWRYGSVAACPASSVTVFSRCIHEMLRTTMAFLWFYDVCDRCVDD